MEREWQGIWHGRESTQWRGILKDLCVKIPDFEVQEFTIGTALNKYKDLIVRKPLSSVFVDDSYSDSRPDRYIPIEAVSNNYAGGRFMGRKSGYKLIQHRFLLEAFDAAFSDFKNLSSVSFYDIDATLRLSIYSARMRLCFVFPYSARSSYRLKVVCQNSVDRSLALTINLFLESEDSPTPLVPFDGFYHTHTQELGDDDILSFLQTSIHRFIYDSWDTDTADRDTIDKVIDDNLTSSESESVRRMLDEDIDENQINLLRFKRILSMLTEEGTQIFREQKLIRFAKLTHQLNELIET